MGCCSIVSRAELCQALWGTDEYVDENALQVNFTRLRKTLAGYGINNRIETIRGKGYRFREQAEL